MMETLAFEPGQELQLTTPELLQNQTVQEYFKAFYELNKGISGFTYRRFSEVIDWPHSYLSDLMSGRKPLTLSRALEFSSHFKLSTLNTERLILMAFKESENPRVQAHFKEQYDSLYPDLKITPNTMGTSPGDNKVKVIENAELSASLMIVGSVISWFRKPLKKSALTTICGYFGHLFPDGHCENELQLLQQYGAIHQSEDTIEFLQDLYFVSPPKKIMGGTEIMNAILQRSDNLNPEPASRMPYRSGLVEFPVTHVEELHQRVCNLANWIGNVSRTACRSENYDPLENPLLKYDLFCGNFIRTRDLHEVFP